MTKKNVWSDEIKAILEGDQSVIYIGIIVCMLIVRSSKWKGSNQWRIISIRARYVRNETNFDDSVI